MTQHQDQGLLERLEKLEWLVDFLQSRGGGGGGGGIFDEPFISVTNTTPYTGAGNKFACNTSAGPCSITINAVPTNLEVFMVIVVGGANTVTINAPATTTIWDPSRAAFETQGILSNGSGGAIAWWQYNQATSQFYEIV